MSQESLPKQGVETAPRAMPAIELKNLGQCTDALRGQAAAQLALAASTRLKLARDDEEAVRSTWGLFLIFDQALEAHLRGEKVNFTADPSGIQAG